VVARAILVRDHELQLWPDPDDARDVLNVELGWACREASAEVQSMKLP